jgi:hypothetical protein
MAKRNENPSRVVLYNVTTKTMYVDNQINRIEVQGFIAQGSQRNTRVKAIFFIDADGEIGRVRFHGFGRSRAPEADEMANDWMDLSNACYAALEDALC